MENVIKKFTVCVSTTKPSQAVTPGGGGGSITLVCPYTGSVLSTLRTAGSENSSKSLLGISSLSSFPTSFSSQNNGMLMAYGGSNRKDDTYGMLLSLRKAPLSPLLHWKCRLPEPKFTAGLSVSPCGHYIVGGGSSGTCYVWSALGGKMIRTVKAHYRSVTKLAWSDCGAYLMTGGADGLIHAFSLLDLVDEGISDGQTVAPIRSWSFHDLGITALTSLPGGRMVSAAGDQRVVVFEIFSDSVITTLQMRHSCSCLAFDDNKIYAGAVQGSIYIIDLDVKAMQQTAQLGVNIILQRPIDQTSEDRVFGPEYEYDIKKELHGHSKAITCIAVFTDEDSVSLVSGDEGGAIRVWDVESRVCVRIIEPWTHGVQSTSTSTESDKNSNSIRPVTDIVVIPRVEDQEEQQSSLGSFTGGNTSSKDNKSHSSIVGQMTPLQKFAGNLVSTDNADGALHFSPVPFIKQKRCGSSLSYWDVSSGGRFETKDTENASQLQQDNSLVISEQVKNGSENIIDAVSENETEVEEQKHEILRLRKELDEARTTIERWEKVNNKLMKKMKR
mmetsp:Transcript_20130/g.27964  ORF Transcript_20130/g.27964 Transcript_20130/m.27964 type:complete len:557 (-) Transcript_20130:965-2635(-)